MPQQRGNTSDRLAFDRASARSYDADGRLRVALTNISKANVCPYLGREIPDYETLGLDPDRTYRLYRDPEELAKAAPTFNGVPLLSRHVPVSAADHRPELVVGSIGTDAEFEAPYLRASLIVWAADAIRDIEAEVKKELSSAYRYRPDMTPGEADGEPYDGVMRDIIANHVAVVPEGRAGSDVVVGDQAPPPSTTRIDMAHAKSLSRKALLASGAIRAYLKPKIAQDAQVDVTAALQGVTAKNYAAKKADIARALTAATAGKLAQDADIGDLTALLDGLTDVDAGDPADVAPPAQDDDDSKLREVLKARGMSDEDIEAICAALKGSAPPAAPAQDDPPPAPGTPPAPDKKDEPEMVTKAAMDAAIAAAATAAEQRATDATIARLNATREAERVVRPWVGDLAIAQDSAEGVYKAALQTLGVKVDGVHPSAFRAILEAQPKPGDAPKARQRVAMDAASTKSFAERFPHAANIRTI